MKSLLLRALRELRLRMLAEVGKRPILLGRVTVRGKGRVIVGDGVRLEAIQAPIELHAGPGAELRIEHGVVIEGGTSIEAMQSVRIGPNARIGAFVKILDNHFHRAEGEHSEQPASLPVVIDEGASVGPAAVVLPGSRIGRAARVGAGAVVSRRVVQAADVHGFPLVPRTREP